MKKLIRLVIVAVVIMGLLGISGCEKSKVKKFVNDYYAAWGSGNMTPEKSYDEYISSKSKELLRISKEEYVDKLKNTLNKNNLAYKSIRIKSITPMEDNIYKIKGDIKTESNGEIINISSDDYVVKEGDVYKFLQYGLNKKELTETSYNSEIFSVSMDSMYTGPDMIMINMIAKNPTNYDYTVGFAGNGKIIVETDQGNYEKAIPGMNLVKAHDSIEGTQIIEGVKGKVNKISLSNVYELGADKQPKDKANSRSYVLYSRK